LDALRGKDTIASTVLVKRLHGPVIVDAVDFDDELGVRPVEV